MADSLTAAGRPRGPGRPQATPEQRHEVRLRIASAALDLFTERGYEATRIADIAERAGVSPRTLWRHFDSKDACLVPLAVETFGAGIVSLVGQWPDGMAFSEFYAGVVPLVRAEPISATVTRFIRLIRDEPALDAMVLRATREIERDVARELAARDGIAVDDIAVRARAAALNGAMRAAVEALAASDAEPDNDTLLRTTLAGLEAVGL